MDRSSAGNYAVAQCCTVLCGQRERGTCARVWQVFDEGIELCNTKSLKKGITRLAEEGYMTHDVRDVVAFIRLCGDRLLPREVRHGARNARACNRTDDARSRRAVVLPSPLFACAGCRLAIFWATLVEVTKKKCGTKPFGTSTWLVSV